MARIFRLGGLLLAAAVFIGFPSLATLYTDWLWFGEVGHASVFTTILGARLALAAAAFAVVALWFFLNLRLAVNTLHFAPPLIWAGREPFPIQLPGRAQLRRFAGAISLLIALPAAWIASQQWEPWLTFLRSAPTGTHDPILGHDVAFYLFTLPVLEQVHAIVLGLTVLAAIACGAVYALAGGLGLAPSGGILISRPAQRHLCALAALFFLALAFGAWLDRAHTLIRSSGLVFGTSYAGVAARLPASWLIIAVALGGAALAIRAMTRRVTLLVLAAGLYLAVSFAAGGYATAVQRFVVGPNEQALEAPYIVNNIAGTRRGFGLEHVEDRELSGDASLTRDDIARNASTLRNVRVWDHQPLLDTFGQLQEIRPYYDFVSVDNDRYVIDGELRQVMLSARELNSEALPNRTWVNERLTFTHGYGLTLGPVNQVTEEGLPMLYIRDLPPVSTIDLPIEQPSLYFGELSNDYVFVRTRAREFHYPRGDDNVTSTYEGTAGVPISSALRKALFAVRFRSQQIFFSSDITNESRVIFYRRIADRVRRIAPFLEYDPDPYLVVSSGRLFWIQDAYTTSTRYPYSTPASDTSGLNYIRNAVKVVVDAYNGTTTFYLADPADPIAATFNRMFPGLFKPLADMPAELRAHIRYPETLFAIQASMYATFHMTNPAVFYNQEDRWEVPAIGSQQGEDQRMQPYYTIMKLPGASDVEFIQMLPLTPRRKDNLAAWMVARSDGAHYGHLIVFRFPKQKVVFGPRQVVARINQDQVISPQITLWNQQGSQVIQGTLLVIPIEESLLYVRPLYLRAQGGRIPELKRVIVAYQNDIVMNETLEGALDQIFGQGATAGMRPSTAQAGAPAPPASGQAPPAPAAQADAQTRTLMAEARAHYDRAIQAQREGDWATYGAEIKQLGEVLQRMQSQAGQDK